MHPGHTAYPFHHASNTPVVKRLRSELKSSYRKSSGALNCVYSASCKAPEGIELNVVDGRAKFEVGK
jgi:hypothetical protein